MRDSFLMHFVFDINGYLNEPTAVPVCVPVTFRTRSGTIDVPLYKHKPVIAIALNLAVRKE